MKHILEIPWGESLYFKKKYDLTPLKGGLLIYRGSMLPKELRQYHSEDFSYARWMEDESNATVLPITPGNTIYKPRDHQKEAASAILKAYHSGWPGFLIGDKTGTGKTLSTLTGITAIAKRDGYGPKTKAKLLIVCPKSVIPQWRQTLRNYPISTSMLRPLVINYQQLNKLLTPPPQARVSKRRGTKNRQTAANGKPTINWDYIIFDEAHFLKNYPKSAASMAAASIAKLNSQYIKGKSPFVIYSTATPGSSPLNFAMMSPWLSKLIDPKIKNVTPSGWGKFLEDEGFHVKKGKSGYVWVPMPWGLNDKTPEEKKKKEEQEAIAKKKQREDVRRIGAALRKNNAPFIMRSPNDIAGWPEQTFIPMPLELTAQQKPIYEEAWTRFRKWLNLTPANSDPKGALVETLRFRQKASLLKVQPIVPQIADWVEQGNQIYISVEFIETLDAYKNDLQKLGISCSEFSGRNVSDRESERLKFQTGINKVIVCTSVAGISLHAEETLPNGRKATRAPRITVIHDIRQNPLDAVQSVGRAHRDGQSSMTYFPYIEGTVENRIVDSFVIKEGNIQGMLGESDDKINAMEKIFRSTAAKATGSIVRES